MYGVNNLVDGVKMEQSHKIQMESEKKPIEALTDEKQQEKAGKRAKEEEDAAELILSTKKESIKMSEPSFVNSVTEYDMHEKINRIMMKVVDKKTEKVLLEYPNQKELDLFVKSLEIAGALVDEKA